MELGLMQWVAGTRCVCKREGKRAVRGVVSSEHGWKRADTGQIFINENQQEQATDIDKSGQEWWYYPKQRLKMNSGR